MIINGIFLIVSIAVGVLCFAGAITAASRRALNIISLLIAVTVSRYFAALLFDFERPGVVELRIIAMTGLVILGAHPLLDLVRWWTERRRTNGDEV